MATNKKAAKGPRSAVHAQFIRDFKRAREALALSQNALAKLAGLSSAYVNQIESGYSLPPPSDTLREILSKAKVPVSTRSALIALGEKVRSVAKTNGRPGRLARRAQAGGIVLEAAPRRRGRPPKASAEGTATGHDVVRVRVPVVPGARLVAFDFVFAPQSKKRGPSTKGA